MRNGFVNKEESAFALSDGIDTVEPLGPRIVAVTTYVSAALPLLNELPFIGPHICDGKTAPQSPSMPVGIGANPLSIEASMKSNLTPGPHW